METFTTVNREFVEKCLIALREVPAPLVEAIVHKKKVKITVDYDPKKQFIKTTFTEEAGQDQKEGTMARRETELALKILNMLSDEGATVREATVTLRLASKSMLEAIDRVERRTKLRDAGRFQMPDAYRNDQTGSSGSNDGGTKSESSPADISPLNSSRSFNTLSQNSSGVPGTPEEHA